MIDECIFENRNLNFKNENGNHKKDLKRRKRIRDAYNELEYGYKIRRDNYETKYR